MCHVKWGDKETWNLKTQEARLISELRNLADNEKMNSHVKVTAWTPNSEVSLELRNLGNKEKVNSNVKWHAESETRNSKTLGDEEKVNSHVKWHVELGTRIHYYTLAVVT